MAGYLGTKAVLLSTTAATVTGDAEIAGDLTVNTNTLVVDSTNNRVGVGTVAPNKTVHVTAASPVINLHSSDASYAQISFTNSGGVSEQGFIKYEHAGDFAGSMQFRTSGAERMRIDAYGNVGIGKSTPTQKLDVAGNVLISGGNTRKFYRAENMVFGTANRVDFAFIGNPSPDPSVYGGHSHAHEIYLEGDNAGYDLVFGRKTRGTSGGVGPDYETMRLDSAGNLLVGAPSNLNSARLFVKATGDACGLQVGSTSGNQAAVVFYDGSGDYCGQIQLNPSSNTAGFISSSDYRLKEDWQPIIGASERVLALNPVNFAWKADGSRTDGFLAHEAQEVVPEAVTGTKDGMRTETYEVTPAVYDDEGKLVSEAVIGTREVPDYQGIDQSKLVPLLTAALQEALTEIAALKDRVAALEAN